MKKVILTISIVLVVALACVSMTACNNTATTQGQLRNILSDHNSESFEYDVCAKDADGNKIEGYDGMYNVTLKAYGEKETFRLFGSYDGKKFSYTRTVNGEKSKGSVEAGGTTYFDNNEFHQALRTITTFSDSLAFSFSVPLVSATEAGSVTLTTRADGKTNVKTPYTASSEKYSDNGIECYKVYVSRTTEVAGISQTLYYAASDVLFNGWAMRHVLVKIEEPFKKDGSTNMMTYELKTATLA